MLKKTKDIIMVGDSITLKSEMKEISSKVGDMFSITNIQKDASLTLSNDKQTFITSYDNFKKYFDYSHSTSMPKRNHIDIIKTHNLGTLYVGGMEIKTPTKPWDLKIIPPGYLEKGDIFEYNGGNIEIRNTDENEEYQLQWIEVNDNGKKLLICDRCILTDISWDELNEQGFVEGKEITIDNKRYNIRLLSGGSNYRQDSFHDGALPLDNEWDRIIANEGNFNGIPNPSNTDLDGSLSSSCYSSSHNKVWNWFCCYSWCKDTYSGSSSSRVIRGCRSASYFDYSSGVHGCTSIGWRPVLEVLE